ncbi:hypothetical protein ACJJTC_003388 [Scirpophaga incertulas]
MGKKRSRDSDDYDIILRKVKKLESKLRKRRRISSASTESDGSYRRFYDTHERENYEELLGEDEIDDVYEDSQPELVEQVAGPSLSLPNSEANATSLPMSDQKHNLDLQHLIQIMHNLDPQQLMRKMYMMTISFRWT